MRFYALEKLINLHDNYTRQFKIDHLQLLLIQSQNQGQLVNQLHQAHQLLLKSHTAKLGTTTTLFQNLSITMKKLQWKKSQK